MVYKYDRARRELLGQLTALVEKKFTGKNAQMIQAFVNQFYQAAAYEDLRNWSLNDFYGAALSFYDFIKKRAKNEIKLRVYNPDFSAHAWQSNHTIIEVITNDQPFLVDSMLMEMNRLGYATYLTMHCGGIKVTRNNKGELSSILPNDDADTPAAVMEAPIYCEIDRISDPQKINQLQTALLGLLHDIDLCVSDWREMQQQVTQSLHELDKASGFLDAHELQESKDYLRWIIDSNFILLGTCDYELSTKKKSTAYTAVSNTGYGILSQQKTCKSIAKLAPANRSPELFKDNTKILVLSKTNIKSHIHRPTYMESIGVPLYTAKGTLRGERILIGMYTSMAYHRSTKDIPFLRRKVTQVMALTNFRSQSHSWKEMINILETLPRDDLFQTSVDELLAISLGIYYLQERRRIRLFVRRDINGQFVSCYVYLPRDRFATKLLRAMKCILEAEFQSVESSYSTRFTDSILARIHFELRIDPKNFIDFNIKDIERKLIEAGRSWEDDLESCLLDYFGEQSGAHTISRYANAFPLSYRENFNAVTALYDIRHIENLSAELPLALNIYKPIDDFTDSIRFKVYQRGNVIAISDVLPILENLGLRVISERPYRIRLRDGDIVWINDFTMLYTDELNFELQQLKEPFQATFAKIWFQQVENDGFNKLVLSTGLGWKQITILRAYAKYFRQMGVTFSQAYIEQTLVSHPSIAKLLVELFELRFNPKTAAKNQAKLKKINNQIKSLLESVDSLDDDRILRHYLTLIQATLRTNYFQSDASGQPKSYLSFKLDPQRIPELPRPRPMFEIFVYSPRFEGIHLRGSKVARGGLRWSDRLEDYRTEVLGLMKAQQVKNAVIVPSGAKGGFVTKRLHSDSTREETIEEGISCYKKFIAGLLDITDNIKAGEVVPPPNVYRYDKDDTYLVVAADKGTATFSDIANAISHQYEFWMDDAFASGGSTGYDHKKMGITARGAWESVKRQFRELNHDIQTTDFTCVGIGDMSGDVFGNGLLLSKHTKLIAAFNHQHIFIDPDPDPLLSHQERQRLFKLPRSTWLDYNTELLSEGGGIYSRRDKSIALSPQVRRALNVKVNRIEPNKLISLILMAPVDLLWNGGIGTYVKASAENSEQVGDRTNNSTRINANQLRCKVVGEGGNLGFTQCARIEYALGGGKIYTDFIDNAGGVDCSDHEVNIKILLNDIVKAGDMTEKQRNQLLEAMTAEVAQLVLKNNYQQTQAISLSIRQAPKNIELHRQYIDSLVKLGILDRALEYLPEDQTITDRKVAHLGLVSPCIAVLVSYTKIKCKQEIIDSDIPEDRYLRDMICTAFPALLYEQYREQLAQHSLRREIVATQISNCMINEMGLSFVFRLQNETGAETQAIVRAYMVNREVFELPKVWASIESLDTKLSSNVQIDMMVLYIRLLRRSTRWILKYHRLNLDIPSMVAAFSKPMHDLLHYLPKCLMGQALDEYNTLVARYSKLSVPKDLVHRLACVRSLFSAFDILEAAVENNLKVRDVAQVYFNIDDQLNMNWIRTQVIAHKVDNNWDALTRESLRDDLDRQQRLVAVSILQHDCDVKSIPQCIARWLDRYAVLVDRWHVVMQNLQKSSSVSFAMLFVAVRELIDLTHTSVQSVQSKDQKCLTGKSDGIE
jgi:glutamate dehydrogenase